MRKQHQRATPIIQDPEINRYINVLGDSISRLTSRKDLDWQFFIVDSKEVNAFAVPGGFVYVNRGLIERAIRWTSSPAYWVTRSGTSCGGTR